MIFYGDIETFSPVPIAHGVYRYAEEAEVLLFSFAIDDGPVRVYDFTEPGPALLLDELHRALHEADEVVFHNSMFDRTVLRLQQPTLCPPLERWRDTMVMAYAHSLPGALAKLCTILDVPADLAKMDAGRELIQLFCKPRPKNSELRRATRKTHPEQWAKFVAYAGADIEAMRAVYKRLPRWNWTAEEVARWHLDQRINDRGMAVDADLARAAIATVERERERLAGETALLTNGAVGSTTQRDALLACLLAEYDVSLPDMKGDTLERRVADDNLPAPVRELIANRLQASSTSPAKYRALLNAMSSDARLRGTTQFRGAARTGRSAGRIFQPQNLMRIPKHIKAVYDDVVAAVKADGIDLVYANAIEAVASVVRGAIVAPPGRRLGISDFSNIEGRKLAWLAGEAWKLAAFAALDAGTGHDLYALAYARAFGIKPEEVMADDAAGGIKRQVGKVQELALGYQGGVGAFVSMAAVYRLDLNDLAERALPTLPAGRIERAAETYAWACGVRDGGKSDPTFGLARDTFVACHSLVHVWRGTNPKIVELWAALDRAAREAIDSPGRVLRAGRISFERRANWLLARLPSGRFLCYPSPRISVEGKLSYLGMNQYTKRWQRIDTYGGKFAENVTQAAAGDVLWAALARVEEAGFEPVLHVHDEIVIEYDEADDTALDRFGAAMNEVPSWAAGLPLSAGTFSAIRYRKE